MDDWRVSPIRLFRALLGLANDWIVTGAHPAVQQGAVVTTMILFICLRLVDEHPGDEATRHNAAQEEQTQ